MVKIYIFFNYVNVYCVLSFMMYFHSPEPGKLNWVFHYSACCHLCQYIAQVSVTQTHKSDRWHYIYILLNVVTIFLLIQIFNSMQIHILAIYNTFLQASIYIWPSQKGLFQCGVKKGVSKWSAQWVAKGLILSSGYCLCGVLHFLCMYSPKTMHVSRVAMLKNAAKSD